MPTTACIYYAHAKCLYGRFEEQQELRAIRRRFRTASIVNPAQYEKSDPYAWAYSVNFYLKLIDDCDVVVFSRCLGKITAELESSVGALKFLIAAQTFPDDPKEALNQLRTLEKTLFNSDPHYRAAEKNARSTRSPSPVEAHWRPSTRILSAGYVTRCLQGFGEWAKIRTRYQSQVSR